jgi:hypothetical protein
MKFLIGFLLCFISVSTFAKVELRQHKAHTHGVAKLDVSLQQDTIDARLDVAGMDLMGFEGTPKTPANKKSLKTVTDLMTKEYSMFILNDDAGCTVTKRDLHKEESKDVVHSDYEYIMTYKCKDLSKIKELEVNLFRDIGSLKQLTVQVVTEKSEKEVKLSPTDSKITL